MRFDAVKKCCSAPYSVNISVTEKCSLKCPMCFQPYGHAHHMPLEQLLVFLDEMASMGSMHVQFSGGEPLLYPELMTAIAYAKSKGMMTRIATSGVGLKESTIYALEKAGLDYCHISLNGSTKELHNLTRSHFEETYDAIKKLSTSKIKTVVNWVANHENISDLKNLMVLAKQSHVTYISVLANKSSNRKHILYPLDKEDLNALYEICMAHNDYLIVENCFYQLHHRMNVSEKKRVDSGCRAGRFYMAIDAKGGLSPCPHLDTFHSEASSIKDFWQKDPELMKLRNKLDEQPSGNCGDCGYKKICRPCLIHQNEWTCMEVEQ